MLRLYAAPAQQMPKWRGAQSFVPFPRCSKFVLSGPRQQDRFAANGRRAREGLDRGPLALLRTARVLGVAR